MLNSAARRVQTGILDTLLDYFTRLKQTAIEYHLPNSLEPRFLELLKSEDLSEDEQSEFEGFLNDDNFNLMAWDKASGNNYVHEAIEAKIPVARFKQLLEAYHNSNQLVNILYQTAYPNIGGVLFSSESYEELNPFQLLIKREHLDYIGTVFETFATPEAAGALFSQAPQGSINIVSYAAVHAISDAFEKFVPFIEALDESVVDEYDHCAYAVALIKSGFSNSQLLVGTLWTKSQSTIIQIFDRVHNAVKDEDSLNKLMSMFSELVEESGRADKAIPLLFRPNINGDRIVQTGGRIGEITFLESIHKLIEDHIRAAEAVELVDPDDSALLEIPLLDVRPTPESIRARFAAECATPISEGLPPLHQAINKNLIDLARLLKEIYGPYAIHVFSLIGHNNWTVLHLGSETGNLEMMEFALDSLGDQSTRLRQLEASIWHPGYGENPGFSIYYSLLKLLKQNFSEKDTEDFIEKYKHIREENFPIEFISTDRIPLISFDFSAASLFRKAFQFNRKRKLNRLIVYEISSTNNQNAIKELLHERKLSLERASDDEPHLHKALRRGDHNIFIITLNAYIEQSQLLRAIQLRIENIDYNFSALFAILFQLADNAVKSTFLFKILAAFGETMRKRIIIDEKLIFRMVSHGTIPILNQALKILGRDLFKIHLYYGTSNGGKTAIHVASKLDTSQILEFLLDPYDNLGEKRRYLMLPDNANKTSIDYAESEETILFIRGILDEDKTLFATILYAHAVERAAINGKNIKLDLLLSPNGDTRKEYDEISHYMIFHTKYTLYTIFETCSYHIIGKTLNLLSEEDLRRVCGSDYINSTWQRENPRQLISGNKTLDDEQKTNLIALVNPYCPPERVSRVTSFLFWLWKDPEPHADRDVVLVDAVDEHEEDGAAAPEYR